MSAQQVPAPVGAPDAPLRLQARWDGAGVSALRIDNRRPRASRLLVGRRVVEAEALVPRLFALCGRAQGIAARLACVAAAGHRPTAAEAAGFERGIAAEAAAEHLWRLLLDWPAMFGLEPRRRRYADWHRRLAHAHEAEPAGREIGEMIGRELLPGFGPAWKEARGLPDFAARCAVGGAAGEVLAQLLALEAGAPPPVAAPALLGHVAAAGWLAAWDASAEDGAGAHAFCAAPTWKGGPAETGALARHADAEQVRVLWEAGCSSAARLWARLLDLADRAARLAGDVAHGDAGQADAAGTRPGVGLARVDCARGVLLHRVHLDGERIADYAICAPTEWNFHPAGPFVREATAVRAADRAAAARRLTVLALALDPCVGYEVDMVDETATARAGGGHA